MEFKPDSSNPNLSLQDLYPLVGELIVNLWRLEKENAVLKKQAPQPAEPELEKQ